MFHLFLFVGFGLKGQYDTLWMRRLFLHGDGHLRALLQEVRFRLLPPLMALAIHILFRRVQTIAPLALLAAMIVGNTLIGMRVIRQLGQNPIRLRFFGGAFIAGSLWAHLQTRVLAAGPDDGWHRGKFAQWLPAVLGAGVLRHCRCSWPTGADMAIRPTHFRAPHGAP
jgi:hypothetical protein